MKIFLMFVMIYVLKTEEICRYKVVCIKQTYYQKQFAIKKIVPLNCHQIETNKIGTDTHISLALLV